MQIKKSFLLFPLLVLMLSQNTYAFEWVYLTDIQERKHYVDKESIREESGYRWAYYKSEYPKQQTGNDFLTKKTYNFTSAVSYLAINCKEKTLAPLSTNYLDPSGSVVHKIRYTNEKAVLEGDKTWELDSNPETFRASVISYVCAEKILN